MSTRACIRIYDGNEMLCCLYKHFDGYPSGVGGVLKDFMEGKSITNGISKDDGTEVNSPDNFPSMFIAWIMTNGGNGHHTFGRNHMICSGHLYLCPVSHLPGNAGEKYLYDIYVSLDGINITVTRINNSKVLYSGTLECADFNTMEE